jgi:hypothetical protein
VGVPLTDDTSTASPRAPAVTVVFGLEASPIVLLDALTESEEQRMRDWLHAHPDYLRLVSEAVDLGEEERRAA